MDVHGVDGSANAEPSIEADGAKGFGEDVVASASPVAAKSRRHQREEDSRLIANVVSDLGKRGDVASAADRLDRAESLVETIFVAHSIAEAAVRAHERTPR
jgi:hypothetical protein